MIMNDHSVSRRGSTAWTILFTGLAVGCFAAAAPAGKPVRAAQVQPGTPQEQIDPDTDGDGLSDPLEAILGTNPAGVDTDSDGFSDAEELARQSDPGNRSSFPGSEASGVGIAVTAHDGSLHAVSALYFQDGSLSDKTFQLGAMIHGNVVNIDPSRYGNALLHIVPSSDPSAVVAVLDARLPQNPLLLAGSMSLFSTVAGADGVVTAASVIDLVALDGVVMERQLSYFSAAPGSTPQTGAGAGGLYRPLGGSIPATWNEGQVCAQSLAVVGVEGPVVTQEVEDAGCEDSLEGACSPGGCSATIGTTVRVMDPLALIGG